MERIITINSNNLPKSIMTKDILTDKLQKAGFTVCDEFHPETELIISIGGDGSFLQTVHDFEFPEVPILGINTGHLGFFPDFAPSDIDHFIESYLVGDYIVQEIPVLQSTVCTKSNCNDVFAVNEVVVKGYKSRTIHLSLGINDHHVQNFSGDGVIISTSTGSTAYNYAARGSIIDPSINVMQITPLAPINTNAYRSFTSSIICSKDSIVKIAPEYRFEDSILIVVDGVEYQFKQIVDISTFVSDLKVKLLRMSNYEFWSRVTEKFL